MQHRHGGDIYAADLTAQPLDFSASINPLGMPQSVREAAMQALEGCVHYPDPQCRALRSAIAEKEKLLPKQVFCGNGAADVVYRLMAAIRPKRMLLPCPTFAEYAQAAALSGCEIVRYPLTEETGFALTADFFDAVTPDIDLVVVCSPNNPTGINVPKRLLTKGLERCRAMGTRLLVDACFHDLRDEPERDSLTDCLRDDPHLIILQSFTKLYAMPGIRLGYCLSADTALLDSLYDMGAPWSVSVIAQACGIAALQDTDFAARTRAYIAQQRASLKAELERLGFFVIAGEANYLLCKNEIVPDLVQKMRRRGILLRSCADFEGLDERWFRTAVRTEAEHFVLLHALGTLVKEAQQTDG